MTKMFVFYTPSKLGYAPPKEWNFGNVEAHADKSTRAESIYSTLSDYPHLYELKQPTLDPTPYIAKIHHGHYVNAIKNCSNSLGESWFYPSVFRANREFNPDNISTQKHVGFYAYDTFTPISQHTYDEAVASVKTAVSAMDLICQKMNEGQTQPYAYALCRPSGHHACYDQFGGYCFFNNAACAAARAREHVKKVAILDLDYHHGNGTQNIFYERSDVLVVNLHADPTHHFPYFAGYEDETGQGEGAKCNLNIILEKGIQADAYIKILKEKVIPVLNQFAPEILIISLGLDTAVTDPLGDFCLDQEGYGLIAELLKQLNTPTLIVQEGGYDTDSIGDYVHGFLSAFANDC